MAVSVRLVKLIFASSSVISSFRHFVIPSRSFRRCISVTSEPFWLSLTPQESRWSHICEYVFKKREHQGEHSSVSVTLFQTLYLSTQWTVLIELDTTRIASVWNLWICDQKRRTVRRTLICSFWRFFSATSEPFIPSSISQESPWSEIFENVHRSGEHWGELRKSK